MLRPRIIPCLLIKNGALIKTLGFNESKYVGDPINAVRIFNEKEVDELIVVDIDATVKKISPNFELIRKLAAECRMPFCYSGGIKTVEQIERIIALGVEKVALSSAAIKNPQLISEAANRVGKQSVVIAIDVKKIGSPSVYEVFTHNGKCSTGLSPVDLAISVEAAGAGEILINSIDCDGMMGGYDLELIDLIYNNTNVPLTVLGGAGTLEDIKNLIQRYRVIGVAAGSFFIFKGKFRAVLINYLTPEEKEELFKQENFEL